MFMAALAGFTVGITADRRWQEQAELLRRRGASIVHGPTIDTQYLADDGALREATLAVIAHPPDLLVATTGIGMRAWMETAATWGLADNLLDALSQARVVARGPKATGAANAAGLEVWTQSENEQMDDVLAKLVAAGLDGLRVAVQEYGADSPSFTAALVAAGATVVEVPVYRWRIPPDTGAADQLIRAATDGRLDAVTFTSAPAVHNLFSIADAGGAGIDLRDAFNGEVVAACVGAVCAEAALQEGIEAPMQPEVGRLGLLVRALGERLTERRRTFGYKGFPFVVQGSAVAVDGRQEALSTLEKGVFELLASRPGVVVDRAALLAKVWGSPDTDPHCLEVAVARLRRKLGPCGGAVSAKAGRGYRLLVDEVPVSRA